MERPSEGLFREKDVEERRHLFQEPARRWRSASSPILSFKDNIHGVIDIYNLRTRALNVFVGAFNTCMSAYIWRKVRYRINKYNYTQLIKFAAH